MSDAEYSPKGYFEGAGVVDILYRSSTDVVIASTSAETDLFVYTVTGYTLDGDHGIRVSIDAVFQNTSGGSVIYIVRVYYGATVLWQDSLTLATGTTRPSTMALALHAKDSDAIQELFGNIVIAGTGAPTVGEGPIGGIGFSTPMYGDSTEDATTELDFKVTIDMDTSSANAKVTLRRALVELL